MLYNSLPNNCNYIITSRLAVRQIVSQHHLIDSLDAARHARWDQSTVRMNFTHSSRKSWMLLCRHGAVQRSPQSARPYSVHQSQQTKWHPISSRWPKLQQTRLSNVKYAMDGTRHVKTLQQILILRQSCQAKWSVPWGE